MTDIFLLRRLFAYDAWANREVMDAVDQGSDLSRPASLLLDHLLSAQRLWLERMQRQPQSVPVWPDFAPAHRRDFAMEMARAWDRLLATLDETGMAASCAYTNSKGRNFTSSVGDILMHVILHSAYHRGQVALRMREAGLEPAYTDFIHATREGLAG